ncbi:hypothetical protein [Loktanella salsilacus]|uniref:hypothetical protein n=1 Tax=Loktanella salsilacus TaxID=195913 RepID=UPI0015876C96|nr:hypothetical protein [Loktanella salsilacus]MBU0779351.1 hypothetical protein [Alphaproteobacteria bacterium]MBU1836707.1 hypothetical protein [Alphaproteobacteria bacterium]UTH50349.1 hypothetical protein KBW81_17395 [Loktanella salsilacus]
MRQTNRDTALAPDAKPQVALAGWTAQRGFALRLAAVVFCVAVWSAVIYWALA